MRKKMKEDLKKKRGEKQKKNGNINFELVLPQGMDEDILTTQDQDEAPKEDLMSEYASRKKS